MALHARASRPASLGPAGWLAVLAAAHVCGRRAYAVFLLCVTTAVTLPAQTFTTLHSFGGTDGAYPSAALVQAYNGSLYGTTAHGGANGSCEYNGAVVGCGTVFKITPSGKLTTLYNFCSQSGCTDGFGPYGGLVLATDGNFYGTTQYGGANSCINGGTNYGCGTVFKITPGGTLTTLYTFCSQSGCPDGQWPYAALVQATNGYLYGTTSQGGVNGGGTVFKITPGGTLTTLYSFCLQHSGCTDDYLPNALVQANNGNFYGTTSAGGANGGGTVFKITQSGTLATLYSFCYGEPCTDDGQNPAAGLVQASDGNFYGTTVVGGHNYSHSGAGTVFKITASGTLTRLHSFCAQGGCADGVYPEAALVQATDGNFYGTTLDGGLGLYGPGTVFTITPSGTLTTLHTFRNTDGAYPRAALVQDTNGSFYGTTSGPDNNVVYGTVFSLSVGLGPFVETQPTSGKVGKIVKILGTNLTGATAVTFNGTAAVFKVVSSSLITTTVPVGAATGTVQVVTPGGTLSSNVLFRVVP